MTNEERPAEIKLKTVRAPEYSCGYHPDPEKRFKPENMTDKQREDVAEFEKMLRECMQKIQEEDSK